MDAGAVLEQCIQLPREYSRENSVTVNVAVHHIDLDVYRRTSSIELCKTLLFKALGFFRKFLVGLSWVFFSFRFWVLHDIEYNRKAHFLQSREVFTVG